MKTLIFISFVLTVSSFHFQPKQIFYRNGRTAWNGTSAYYDNGRTAWNGTSAYHENASTAWNGTSAYHDNGSTAWNGTSAYYDNGRTAWNGTSAYHKNGIIAWNGTSAYYDNGQILTGALSAQIQNVTLHDLELSELEISDKIKLLTKTFNSRVYVVGLKIQLSEKNSILINKEDKLTTNIIQLHKDIHFEAVNKKARLSILGQKVL